MNSKDNKSHKKLIKGVEIIMKKSRSRKGIVLIGAVVIAVSLMILNVSVQAEDMGEIHSGETKLGNIAIEGEVDIFTFDGVTGQAVFIDITADNSSLGPAFYLYRPNGTLELTLPGGDMCTHLRIAEYQLQQTGVYTIALAASYGWGTSPTGAYGISLLLIPGNTSSSQDPDGGAIASGHTYNFTINPVADTDAFTFYGTAGQAVFIDITANNSSLGPAFYLYRPNRTLELTLPGGDMCTHLRIDAHQLEQTGVYTIVLAANLGWGTSPTGGCDISLLLIPGNTSSSQDPDGGDIASGHTYNFTINPVADTDAFAFYGTAGQAVFIDITADNSSLGPAFYLYRPNRTLELTLPGGDMCTHLRIEQTGVYTIVLAANLGWGTSPTGGCDISLLLIPGATSSSQDPDGGDIASGHLSNYTINPVADTDAFTFYGTAGHTVIIDITANNSSLGPAIYLYRPNRTLELTLPGGDMCTHLRIEAHQLEQTGIYTIVIAVSLGWGTSPTGGYDLSFVKIPPTPSPGIYNPFPPNEATLIDLSQSFSWDPVSGATGYDLYFGENVIIPLEKIGDNLSSPGMPFPDLEGNNIYYWHVNAHTPSGIVEGVYWWFKTESTNQPPVYGTPTPANGSTNRPLSFTWSIPINDPEGNLFSWTIQCSNGQTNSGTGAANGTKSLSLSGLAYSTLYNVWVNATDPGGSGVYTRRWYTFTIKASLPPVFGTPTPSNGSTNNPLSFSWSIPINDPEGDRFSWTIQCSNGQTNSGTGATNGTKSVALSGLAYSTTYKVWVNATDPTGSGLYTRRWYTFTTKVNNPPVVGSPSPANGATNTRRPPAQLQITVTDLNNDSLDVSFHWKNHTGKWVSLQTYTGVGNGSYAFIPSTTNEWIWGNTTYFWSVNVTDGVSWTNETFHYTTNGSRYDVNNDDKVNFQDAGLVWVHRTSLTPYDGIYDVNNDGQVNFQDAGLTWTHRN